MTYYSVLGVGPRVGKKLSQSLKPGLGLLYKTSVFNSSCLSKARAKHTCAKV